MANTSGSVKKANPDDLFDLYYNAGARRTYVDVAKLTKEQGIGGKEGVHEATVRRYADEFDWSRRADALDDETRKIRDKRLANMIAQHRVREIEITAALQTKFMRRLMPGTPENPNPVEIQPEELDANDWIQLGKFFELLTGHATSRIGGEDTEGALSEMERQILDMDNREHAASNQTPALTAGEEVADGS